ncbi:MAG: ferritin family protein [Candidatus Nitrosocaldaceae archaeon]
MDNIEKIALYSCKEEYNSHKIYLILSQSIFTPSNIRSRFKIMAEQEYEHYLFWSRYVRGYEPKISYVKIFFIKLLILFMGATFIIKILEKHESNIINEYKHVMHLLDEEEKHKLEIIIDEEEKHEDEFTKDLNEARVKYLGFIVLGLSDALIEIAGIHAGTLGAYTDTFKAGLAGLIAGVAASIAMASAAYNQAKQNEVIGKPVTAAMYTGIAYILTALLLAFPYFVIHDIIEALLASLIVSIGILAYISLYSYILYNRNFFRELGETSAIIFGATLALYIFGDLIGEYLGITP